MSRTSTIKIPASQNILQYTARFVTDEYKELSPDFSTLFVFLPYASVTPAFNANLCRSTGADLPAIIPPWSGTLRSWVKQYVDNAHPDYQLISEHARQLLFIEALQQHPTLFNKENQWQVTQALLKLFDELSLNQIDLFTSADSCQQKLASAYGIDDQQQSFSHLNNESRIVYTLWHAWQQQLTENSLLDDTADYMSRLAQADASMDLLAQQYRFICLGLSQYTKTEQAFLQQLIDQGACRVIEYRDILSQDGDDATDTEIPVEIEDVSARSSFIRETFSYPDTENHPSIKQRAHVFAEQYPTAFTDKPPFSVYLASDEERQVRAIDYFIRLNLLEGKTSIGVISEDRKLSRRLRALLERSAIPLQDNAGWSLATTQAASIIERWLECIEEDFSAYPLLDCLKSPFIDISQAVLGEQASPDTSDPEKSITDDFKQTVYRFEHDLVFHENVSSNIEHYKTQLADRLQRLEHWPANTYHDLITTLDYLQQTAEPLQSYYSSANNKHSSANKMIRLSDFFAALMDSLKQLGVLQCYRYDDAGLVLLDTFEQLKQSLLHADPMLSWDDCRSWLGMALEAQNFTPATDNASVQLMTLEQSSHLHFDCVIIAAAEAQHYPGSADNSPFFNQSVRAALGLDTWELQRQLRHEQFNCVLLSAPSVLITAVNEDKGEEKPVSPWLQLLLNFYTLGYADQPGFQTMHDQRLQQLVQSDIDVFNCDDTTLPNKSQQASARLPADMLPERISASSYQRIINCPYQFFSADGLRLIALEEISDELKKSDYGERVHTILQTFHRGHKRYGKAFAQKITAANRASAEQYLNTLSERIFVDDVSNNVLHRSWLYRWQKHIPAYISWQIRHQKDWDIYRSEVALETPLSDSEHTVNVYGRLDRIDKKPGDDTHAIIDYKTGRTATQDDVDNGENVQLSLYALLDDEASNVQYLSVDSSEQKVESRVGLTDQQLQDNKENNRKRLLDIFTQLDDSQPLPAWGDESVCSYCNFSGLCRKPFWSDLDT